MAPSFPRLQGGRRKKDVEPLRREKKRGGLLRGSGLGVTTVKSHLAPFRLPSPIPSSTVSLFGTVHQNPTNGNIHHVHIPPWLNSVGRSPHGSIHPFCRSAPHPQIHPRTRRRREAHGWGRGGATPPSFQQRGNITGASAPKAGQRRRKSCQMDPICRPPPWAMFPPVCVCG